MEDWKRNICDDETFANSRGGRGEFLSCLSWAAVILAGSGRQWFPSLIVNTLDLTPLPSIVFRLPNQTLQPTATQRLGLRLLLEPIYGFSLFNAIAAEGRGWLSLVWAQQRAGSL